MATICTIDDDYVLASGQRNIRWKFEFDDGTHTFVGGRTIESEDDAAAIGAALIPRMEDKARQRELRRFVQDVGNGVDPNTITLTFTTKADALALVFKRALNAMREASDVADRFEIIRRIAPVAALYTDAQIANGVGWTEQQVAAARAKMAAAVSAMNALDHGEPEFEDVGF